MAAARPRCCHHRPAPCQRRRFRRVAGRSSRPRAQPGAAQIGAHCAIRPSCRRPSAAAAAPWPSAHHGEPGAGWQMLLKASARWKRRRTGAPPARCADPVVPRGRVAAAGRAGAPADRFVRRGRPAAGGARLPPLARRRAAVAMAGRCRSRWRIRRRDWPVSPRSPPGGGAARPHPARPSGAFRHLVRFARGHRAAPEPTAPRDFAPGLPPCWPGDRHPLTIALSAVAGEPTLASRAPPPYRAADRAATHPLVRAILDAFPGRASRRCTIPVPMLRPDRRPVLGGEPSRTA